MKRTPLSLAVLVHWTDAEHIGEWHTLSDMQELAKLPRASYSFGLLIAVEPTHILVAPNTTTTAHDDDLLVADAIRIPLGDVISITPLRETKQVTTNGGYRAAKALHKRMLG